LITIFPISNLAIYNQIAANPYRSYKMDALSHLLSLLHVRSGILSRFEGQGDWALAFPAYEHLKFGTVLSGRLHLWLADEDERYVMEQGDFWLLTNGKPFFSATDPAMPAIDGPLTYQAHRRADGTVRFDRPGKVPPVTLVSGRFAFENALAGLLLNRLPPIIHLRAADYASHALTHVLALLTSEHDPYAPGSGLAKTAIATLVLIQALRAHSASSERANGWLKALSDPKVGMALSLMHSAPDRRWRIETLASEVGMSRTAFAVHFKKAVGQAPLDYLHQWRMAMAMRALRHTDVPLVSIAESIGYLSDTAFSIAFKRATGVSPGQYRVRPQETLACSRNQDGR
jgi:AraC-like DNA-binding protein